MKISIDIHSCSTEEGPSTDIVSSWKSSLRGESSSSFWAFLLSFSFSIWDWVAREIMHTAAQSMHEYVWHVKWDQGKRNGQLGRSNSHPPDRESCQDSLCAGAHVNYHIVRLTWVWHFVIINKVLPEGTVSKAFWVLVTHDKRRDWM